MLQKYLVSYNAHKQNMSHVKFEGMPAVKGNCVHTMYTEAACLTKT